MKVMTQGQGFVTMIMHDKYECLTIDASGLKILWQFMYKTELKCQLTFEKRESNCICYTSLP